MRITDVTTRVGDKGETQLVGGAKVSKASRRVDAYGDIDELNSVLGLVRAKLSDPEIDSMLGMLQNDLFTVGADLASPAEIAVPRITEEFILKLEGISAKCLEELGPLTEFILPGGSDAGATLHVARTVARRAERRAVLLGESEEINDKVIVYLNRLSDVLFNLARAVNHRLGVKENLADFSKRSHLHDDQKEQAGV